MIVFYCLSCLQAYASILYLKMPENFEIRLRGKAVEHLSIADDLKFAERILYKPQIGPSKEYAYREVKMSEEVANYETSMP